RSPGIVLHTMSAAAAYLNLVGWKCYTTTSSGGGKFLVGLYDAATGNLVALIEADRLGQLRTAATTGVAVQWMAQPDATEVGLIGTGWQARGQLAAVAAVRPIQVAYVYGRNEDRRQRFADEMSGELEIEVRAVDRPHEAVEELPIIVTATNSREPVLHGVWLAEPSVVCAVGSNWLNRAEIDADAIRRADHIVCDSVAACRIEAGDFTDAIERGMFDWAQAVELADVVAGRAVGRGSRGGVSLFKSVGLAIEDVALGSELLQLARLQGIGQPLPL
ncbi:MAG TPA: ornithine cyclodeaminase family protein, partial [Pirellulales bacterium]|nr:ornithine cyclodeaminase family protein [Pirellulales bacterium]